MDKILKAENSRSADYNFGNIYIWDKHYRQLISRIGDRVCIKIRLHNHPAYSFPVGSGELKPAIDSLLEFTASKGYPLVMFGVEERHIPILDALYPGRFTYEEDSDHADYIYSAQKLSTYAGKAMHGKKNHCNRFEAEHNWHFEPLTRDLIPGCMDMLAYWNEFNAARLDASIVYEHDAILRAFAGFEALSLEGGVLFAEDAIIGFSIGELTNDDCFDVHFEKADININGAYPMVCREMTKLALFRHPELLYINREDDMGLESLRQSKQSYKPEYLLKKYQARWNCD